MGSLHLKLIYTELTAYRSFVTDAYDDSRY